MKRTSLPLQRREFITLLGGAVAAWPLSGAGAATGQMPIIGFLGAHGRSGKPACMGAAFVQRRANSAGTRAAPRVNDRVPAGRRGARSAAREIAAELVRAQGRRHCRGGPNAGGQRCRAARPAGNPNRFRAARRRPDASGLVATSLARPGANVTGLANLGIDLVAKRLDLLREVPPGPRRGRRLW